VGLVGVGNVVRWLYLPRLRRPDSPFRLAAIYDVDSSAAEHVAAQLGAEVCGSLKDLTRHASVEAVFVCTPVRFIANQFWRPWQRETCDMREAVGPFAGRGTANVEAACKVGMAYGQLFLPLSARFFPYSPSYPVGDVRSNSSSVGSISQGQWFAENGQPSGRRTDAAQWKYGPEGGVV
jgi:hypothetical protein